MTIFFSHRQPDVLLKDHLRSVGETGRRILLDKRINHLDKQFLSDVAYLIGISHDFGKFTHYFQDYLDKKRSGDGLTHHGLISALFTYEVLSEFVKIKKYENNALSKNIPLLGYFIVKHHHGNLDDIKNDADSDQLFKEFSNIREQISDIRKKEYEIEKIYSNLFVESGIEVGKIFNFFYQYEKNYLSPDELDKIIKSIRKDTYYFNKESSDQTEMLHFLITQILYSVLIDSDKKHAGRVEAIQRHSLPQDIVEQYKACLLYTSDAADE